MPVYATWGAGSQTICGTFALSRAHTLKRSRRHRILTSLKSETPAFSTAPPRPRTGAACPLRVFRRPAGLALTA